MKAEEEKEAGEASQDANPSEHLENSVILSVADLMKWNKKLPRGYMFKPVHEEPPPPPAPRPKRKRTPKVVSSPAQNSTPKRTPKRTPPPKRVKKVRASPQDPALAKALEEKRKLEEMLAETRRKLNEFQSKTPTSTPTTSKKRSRDVGRVPVVETNSKRPVRSRRSRVGSGISVPSDISKCLTILNNVMSRDYAQVFLRPVDPERDFAIGYFDVIKFPMDLGTIKNNLIAGYYDSPEEMKKDVDLVFYNARLYNLEGSEVCRWADQTERDFQKQFAKINRAPKESVSALTSKKDFKKKKPKHKKVEKIRPKGRPRKTKSEPPQDWKLIQEMKARMDEMTNEMTSFFQAFGKEMPRGRKKAAKPRPVRPRKPKPMSKTEKRNLKENISMLDANHLGVVVQIIQKNMPKLAETGEHVDEIVVDIDALNPKTLRELEKYVKKCVTEIRKKQRQQSRMPNNPVDDIESAKRAIEEMDRMAAVAMRQSTNNLAPSGEDEEVIVDDEPGQSFPTLTDTRPKSDSDSDSSSSDSSDSEDEEEHSIRKAVPVPVDPGLADRTSDSSLLPGVDAAANILVDEPAKEKSVEIQNAADWMSLDKEVSEVSADQSAIASEPLWSEYQKKEEELKQREREREEKEKKLQKEREERERRQAEVFESFRAAEEEAKLKREQEEKEKKEEEQRLRDEKRLAAKLEREKLAKTTEDVGFSLSSMASFEKLGQSAASVSVMDALKLKQSVGGTNGSPADSTNASSDTKDASMTDASA